MMRLRMLVCLLIVLSFSAVAHANYASPGIEDGKFVSLFLENAGAAHKPLDSFGIFNGMQVDVAIIGGNTAWGQDSGGLIAGGGSLDQLITVAQAEAAGWYARVNNVPFNSLYFKSESPFSTGEYFSLTDANLGREKDRKALVAFELTSVLNYNGRDYNAGTILVCFEDMHQYEAADYDYNDMIVAIAPTPVPAAVWLLGSGLAGLVALRRRNK